MTGVKGERRKRNCWEKLLWGSNCTYSELEYVWWIRSTGDKWDGWTLAEENWRKGKYAKKHKQRRNTTILSSEHKKRKEKKKERENVWKNYFCLPIFNIQRLSTTKYALPVVLEIRACKNREKLPRYNAGVVTALKGRRRYCSEMILRTPEHRILCQHQFVRALGHHPAYVPSCTILRAPVVSWMVRLTNHEVGRMRLLFPPGSLAWVFSFLSEEKYLIIVRRWGDVRS